MKKFLSILLSLAVLPGLCACTGAQLRFVPEFTEHIDQGN